MIIVTGGAGFIGSNLVAALEEKDVGDIVICDWAGNDERWQNFAKREIRDFVFPENLFDYLDMHADKVEAIFHMGAISATTEKDVDKIVTYNFGFTRDLWSWCSENGVRLIYASSAATYGDGTKGFEDFEKPEELATLRPLNAYGWSKHAFDRRVARIVHGDEDVGETAPPQWAGLKFFNVYGPNEYHKGDMMSVICKLYPKIMNGEDAKLFKSHKEGYEDGGQTRDFVYVGDCVSVMIWLLDNPHVSGLFNVGSGKGRTFKDLALATFKAAGLPPKITYIDMPEQLRGKYQYFTEADMNKLRNAGYDKPFTELEDGVEEYVKKFMSQEDKYR